MIQPVLHTPRLHLQPLASHHIEAMYGVWGDPDVIWWGHHTGLDQTAAFVERLLGSEHDAPPGSGWWVIFDRRGRELVGDVVLQLVPRPSREMEIGWHLARSQWGHGYATEAATRLLEHAFETLRLDIVVADIAFQNSGSIAVAERLGMHRRPDPIERAGMPHGVWEIGP